MAGDVRGGVGDPYLDVLGPRNNAEMAQAMIAPCHPARQPARHVAQPAADAVRGQQLNAAGDWVAESQNFGKLWRFYDPAVMTFRDEVLDHPVAAKPLKAWRAFLTGLPRLRGCLIQPRRYGLCERSSRWPPAALVAANQAVDLAGKLKAEKGTPKK
jgi:hypothetical protein